MMTKSIWIAVGCGALLWSGVARAQVPCPGDCNDDDKVVINELITCVNIALDNSPVSVCPACDVNGDGTVTINELILAVNVALLPACPPPVCGNDIVQVGEECDDGNNFGGDGCATNCTTEDVRVGIFNPAETVAVVQTEALPLTLHLTGQQTFRTGHARPTDATLASGGIFPAGQIPTVIKADELLFKPVSVSGLVCACVRGIPVPAFGPGIAGNGSIGCGDAGLTNIDYRMIQDHDTTPGDPGNKTMGTPDDPECDATSPAPGGGVSTACLEGTGANCSMPENTHTGVCQGPRVVIFSGGMEPKGSALIINSTAIGLLSDGGACDMTKPMRNGKCLFPDYGPDCLPCTDDDLVKGTTEINPTTTGSAEAALFDANPPGGAIIDKNQDCFGSPCMTQVHGSLFDCSQLGPGTSGGLSGGSLGVCFPTLDAAQIGDNVTCTVFSNQ
jgi:cysteine-rich repeat protein